MEPGNNSSDPADWIDLYGDFLFRYAVARVRDPHHAEDLVQETLLAALQSRDNFESRSSERTWLVGILKHKIIDYFRKAQREESAGKDASPKSVAEGAFRHNGRWKIGPAEWKHDSSTLLEKKEFWEILRDCLAELPARPAEAFMLREIEALSTGEICKVLNVSTTNLWVILYRARFRLRECLEINWFGKKRKEESS